MRGQIRQVTIVALSAGGLLVGGAAPTAAAEGDDAQNSGARTVKESQCYDYGYATQCSSRRQVSQEVETPSGNRIEQGKTRSSEDFTYNGGDSYSSDSASRYQRLSKDGQAHSGGGSSSNSRTDPYNGTCTSEWSYHYVGNESQFDDYGYQCN